MMGLLRRISPLPRLINSSGLDEAFVLVANSLPGTKIHAYPAGMELEDWVVPGRWEVTCGVMKDRYGKVIASTDECLLFVAPYSEPVNGWFRKEEIAKHLRTRPDRPYAFMLEHRNAYDYRLKTWGITLPHARWVELPEGEYHVKIDVQRGGGAMKVAECHLPGRRPETICINAHIDELCNDDLAGCVVAIELMRSLQQWPQRRYTYSMVLSPELLGTLFYAGTNPDKLGQTIGMLNLETVGAGAEWCLKRTMVPEHRLDRLLRLAFSLTKVPCREIGFFEGYGNDERVYGWPTYGIPGVAIQRFPFAEYHTSDDTPAIVSPSYLLEALNVAEQFVTLLEKDYVPCWRNRLPPYLTRRGLYFDSKFDTEPFHRFNNLVQFHIDGKRSVLDLAALSGVAFSDLVSYLDQFVKQQLIVQKDVPWSCPASEGTSES